MTELSAEQIDEVRSGVRTAAAGSHSELSSACSRYMRRFGITYRELRQIADVRLPDYLAGVPAAPTGKVKAGPDPTLTGEQVTALIIAYRGDLSAGRSPAEQQNLLRGFAGQFGVRIYVLKRVLSADERANPQLYKELRAAGQQLRDAAEARRKAAEAQKRAEKAQRKAERERTRNGKSRRKSGKSGGSVWTVGGGLPGSGKRS